MHGKQRMHWNVTANDRECLAAIVVLNRQWGQGNYSQQHLADYLECSRATVINLIERLRHAGILETQDAGGRNRLRYTVHVEYIPLKWKEIYPTLWTTSTEPPMTR